MKKYLIISLFAIQGIVAQVQFVAQASKTSLGINERLRIDFAMNEDGDNFTPPNFEGFRIVGGPNQSVSYQWINGKKSFEKTYSYFLMPLKKGSFVIKTATIEINGQIYKTNPIKVTIGNAVAEERDPYDPYNPYPQNIQQQYKGKEGVHLVAEISNSNPFENEPITVVYKIYVSNRTSVGGWSELESPKYKDFWNQNIDIKQLHVSQVKFKGEDYRCAILRKTILYPQKTGKLALQPLTLDVQVEVPTGRVDPFGRMEMAMGTKKISAGANIINVKPLPTAGKPEPFNNAVGNFDFKVIPSKTKLKNGESLELKVLVSGKGNLKLFTLPKPVLPSSLEVYDPKHQENITTPLSGMQGEISDTYTIVPQYKGVYPIKPLEFTYFDLKTKTYKKIFSKAINIEVLDGPTMAQSKKADAPFGENETKKVLAPFGNIQQKTVFSIIEEKDFLGSNLFYTLLFLPFLLIPIIIFVRNKKEELDNDTAGNKTRLSNKLAKKYLSQAKKHLGNKELFYVALEKAMHNFLKAKLQIETTEMSKDKISLLLLDKGADTTMIDAFIALTENCEVARYAPATKVSIKEDYDKAVSIILELEKQLKK